MVFQSQKLSFDASPLDDLDLEGPQADLSENDPIKPPMKADGEQDPIQAFNFELEELLKRGREQTSPETQSDIKVNVNQSDNFTLNGGEKQKPTFKEFLFDELGGAQLPVDFKTHVNAAIGLIQLGLEDVENNRYTQAYSHRGRLGVVLNCDIDKCDSFGPYAGVAKGFEQRKGVLALKPINDASLIIIGSKYNDDLSDQNSINSVNVLREIRNLSKAANTPVYFVPMERHFNDLSRTTSFSTEPGVIVQPDGSVSPF